MKSKDKFILEFFDKIKKDISFINLKKQAAISLKNNEYILPRELPVPVRVNKLVQDIEKQKEIDGISLNNIIDGIIYIIGVDKEFIYVKDYMDILDSLGFNIKPYIINHINNVDEKLYEEAVVYGKALVNIEENEKTCFIYASALENMGMSPSIKNEVSKQRFLEEAHRIYERALDFDDKFSLPYYKLGYYYKNAGQYLKAEAFWKKHQELDSDFTRGEEIRQELIQLKPYVDFENGYNLVLKEHPNEGLELLLPLLKKFNGWWNLLFFIGLAYRMIGEYGIAETYFENVLKIKNNQKEALNELGLCKMCRGKYVEADDVFSKLLSLDPGNVEVFCNRSVALLYNKQIDRAYEDIQTALKINPNDEVALSIKKEIEKEMKK